MFRHFNTYALCPSVFLQFLAFENGEAFSSNGDSLTCPEWENVPYVVLQEVRDLFFTSYPRIINGGIKPDSNGFCIIQDISNLEIPINTGIRSECGMIMPNERGRIIDAWQFPAEKE